MPDWLTKEQRSRNMAAIRSQGTKPEARLGLALRSAFPRRKIVERPLLPGRPDFYMPGLRLAVFADGCFWHGCPKHGRTPGDNAEYWEPKLARNIARAREVRRQLKLSRISSVRLWEHDLEPNTINRAIRRVISAARKTAAVHKV